MDIVAAQAELDRLRTELRGTEAWEFIADIPHLKLQSPKYIAYRKSGAYVALMKLRRKCDGGRCHKCGSNKKLHFHHLTYDRLFKELLTDGVTLCSNCHLSGHKARKEVYELSFDKGNSMTASYVQTAKNLSRNKPILVEWMGYYRAYDPVANSTITASAYADKLLSRNRNMSKSEIRRLRQKCGFTGQVRKGDNTTVMLVSPTQLYKVAMASSDYTKAIEDQIEFVLDRYLDKPEKVSVQTTQKVSVQTAPKMATVSSTQKMTVPKPTTTPAAFQVFLDAAEKAKGKIKYYSPDGSSAEVDFS